MEKLDEDQIERLENVEYEAEDIGAGVRSEMYHEDNPARSDRFTDQPASPLILLAGITAAIHLLRGAVINDVVPALGRIADELAEGNRYRG